MMTFADGLKWLELTHRWELLNEYPEANADQIAAVEDQILLLGYRRVGNDWQPLNQWIGEDDGQKTQVPQSEV